MSIISEVLKLLFNYVLSFTGDYGLAIILITIIVKLGLLPLSLKQRKAMIKQQKFSVELAKVEEKYKNNSDKLKIEREKLYKESFKSFKGCLGIFIQMPVIAALYTLVLRMPEVSTIVVPWVYSIKLSDSYFIIPIIYALSSVSPMLLNYFKFFKVDNSSNLSKATFIPMIVFSLILTIKTPIAIGIYFITSSIFSFLEELTFKFYYRIRYSN
ncbi:YidC/Oxa1 family membrane protein insertase [Clostridium magnum]|uniref:Membrane protein insertase YidC n=1 Tax=Clostridium magnum DSM 2767 TaxID=1121326 RepID=A0A162QP52_9CLOT|nr:membrane protein insertase YidC [Clostridium magnum]KZL88775.1 membrane protein insertase YidC [Clostridium magnum DSM 2767]SHJ50814.1 membrane protein insertase, YidC/Oxa1 family, C-terminal domain-containing protein [Clostridium magnum DSM 2767]